MKHENQMRHLNYRSITIATIFLAAFTCCKKDTYQAIVGKCPVIVSTSPTDNEKSVALNKVVSATFNEKMNPASFTQESFVLMGASRIAGNVTYSEADST